jgi:precorrin-6Y C5,15-methyltransferase (decarboxylating)
MSLHGGLIPGKGTRAYTLADLPSLLAEYGKLAILTDGTNNPTAIAEVFVALPALPPVKIFVCEKLGYGEQEMITSGAPEEIAGKTFSDLNVVILLGSHAGGKGPDRGSETYKKPPSAAARFGLTEKEFSHSRGLITKDEVRAVTLHKLRLPSEGVLWDVGAGSGSLSIEAARLSPGLSVFAVERDDEQVAHMKQNKRQFDLSNMEIVKGEAPYALDSLPDPDRVFVGGSGGSLAAIIALTGERMRAGAIVINCVTLETVDEAVRELEARGFQIDLSQVSVSRLKELGERRYLKALNPVFIIRGEKP